MRYAFLGALLVVGGIATQIVAARHYPPTEHLVRATGTYDVNGACQPSFGPCSPAHYVAVGLSSTTYDLVRVGGWALLIFGAVIVVFALVRELRRP